MESPLLRLKGEIENFTANESQFTPAPLSRHTSSSAQAEPTPEPADTTILPVSSKGKGKAKVADPLLRGVLRHNLYSNQSTDEFSTAASPARPKAKPKTPVIPKTYNPYLPPNTDPKEWNGVVNLSDASILTPQGYRSGKRPASQRKLKTPTRDDSDDSIDLAGMSPPVLMSPARPPRSSAELGLLKVGQSPVKQAAARIKQDLLRDVQANSARKFQGRGNANPIESSMSTVSTPPSLSRYHRADASDSAADDSTLENMLRRVGLAPTTAIASTPGLRVRSKVKNDNTPQAAYRASSSPDSGDNLSQNPLFTPGVINEDDGSLDDWDSDSFDDEVNPGIVSARPGAIQDDDAFDSDDSSDSLTDEIVGFVPPPGHPVDDYIEEDSESFDYDNGEVQEETVFGVPPAQRLRAAAAQQHGLRLHGGDLLDDTIGAQAIAGVRNTDESPTPASWGSNAPLR
jgi:DASH complex subunit ASK1